MPAAERKSWLDSFTPKQARLLRYHWPFWARPNQLAPAGNWRTWLVMAGRGFGKTRLLCEWARARVESGICSRLAFVAPTAADARDVLVEGESGILAISPPHFRPLYEPSKRRLTWPNGAIATTYSADEPDRLRGPQHDGAICDEIGAWKYPEAWDMLMFGLRLGADPRVAAATTPKPVRLIRDLLQQPTTALTRGSTYENAGNLAPAFLEQIISKYEGTRLGRQELNAELLDDVPGALWTRAQIDALRAPEAPELLRVVVAIDPAMTSGESADETGIVVAGKGIDGHGYVLADLTCRATPDTWARRAINAYRAHEANLIVAEVNNGGELVEFTLKTVDRHIPYKAVHASRGKRVRAEPVAALYEQCVAVGVPVETERGPVPIEEIRRGDRVWTREGLRRVLWSGQTGVKPTVTIRGERVELTCTTDHPVYAIGRGFVHAEQLVPSDTMLAWKQPCVAPTAEIPFRALVVAAVHALLVTDGGHRDNLAGPLWSSRAGATTSRPMATGVRAGTPGIIYSTAMFGRMPTARFQMAGMFTTSTVIPETTAPKIWSRWIRSLTARNTPSGHSKPEQFGRGYPDLRRIGGLAASHRSAFVNNAAASSQLSQPAFDSARRPATRATGITSVEPNATLPVYNLTVEGEPEFFAGGALVHNCKVHHIGAFPDLEDQMCNFVPDNYDGSPDRVDALVWALTELMVSGGGGGGVLLL